MEESANKILVHFQEARRRSQGETAWLQDLVEDHMKLWTDDQGICKGGPLERGHMLGL